MAGRFEGVSDLEWRLFEDVFPPAPPKRGRGMPHAPFRRSDQNDLKGAFGRQIT